MQKDNALLSKWLPIFVVAVLLILVYKLLGSVDTVMSVLNRFLNIVSPFLFGVLICYFLYIPCQKLEKVYKSLNIRFIPKRARLFSVLSVYLCVTLLIILFIVVIVPILIASLIDLASNIPLYYSHILNYINNLPSTDITDLDLKSHLNDFAINTLSQLFDPVKVEQMARSVFGLAGGVLRALISLIVSLYILLDRDNIFTFFRKLSTALFKSKTRVQIKKYLDQANNVLFIFIASKGLDSIINWIAVTTILLVFNVKYAVLLGIIAGFANFIPYLGSLVAVIFISFLTLLTGGMDVTIKTLILLIIFQQLDANFIEPKIMGRTLKISPILVIFSVIFGGAYFGVVGMFLAVPIATILKQMLIEYIDSKKQESTQSV
ncbi:MAG: AI-2E family transporter [Chitinispirillales bacterium]|jgi:predicted PurR-regulated permease PerM|nr:AI-2E family transporter [Chitinispirillales bacterium]